jgi:dUTP pyrophosphatase
MFAEFVFACIFVVFGVKIVDAINNLRYSNFQAYSPQSSEPKVEEIKFTLTDNASMPQRATIRSAGYDLKASEHCVIPPRSHRKIRTGVQVTLPSNTYGRIASRSGLSVKHGLEVGAGIIDEDYENEIMVNLFNHSDIEYIVEQQHRIAQLIVQPCMYPTTIVNWSNGQQTIQQEPTRVRGMNGFGSTGI